MITGFARDRRGGISILAAAMSLIGCLLSALVVDIGSLALQARRLQGVADLAAMAAATDLSRAEIAATATVAANLPNGDAQTTVTPGRYTADRDMPAGERFAPGDIEPNAVKITVRQTAPFYFGSIITGTNGASISRSATASLRDQPQAMISIGSRLASLDGGVANQVLGGLTGSTVSLNAMDYRSLADARVNLLQFSDALATDLDVEAGDYTGLLDRTVNAGRALKVIQDLAGDQGDSALSKLSAAAANQTLRLGDLIGVETGADDLLAQGLDAEVSTLDLATALVEVGGGDRQIALDLAGQPGLASVTASLAIGERPNRSPWLTVTSSGAPVIRTAQARLYLRARTSQKVSGLAQVDLPVLVEVASAEARLEHAACKPEPSATVGVRPGVARASIGAIDESRLGDFTRTIRRGPATLVSVVGLVKVSAQADVEAANVDFHPLAFSAADISAQRMRSMATTGLVNGAVTSLIDRLQIDVQALGLGLGLSGLSKALGDLLKPLGPVLDGVVNPILDLLGLKFGEADVTVHRVECGAGRVKLVG
jgi:uncharacterized membrane protein